MLKKIQKKSTSYLHGHLTEAVQVDRKPWNVMIWSFFGVFVLCTIGIMLGYYFLYIDGQLVRIDLDYSDRSVYLDQDKKITCDCALPIIVNPVRITSDPYFKQPDFQICLKRELRHMIAPELLNNTAVGLSFNLLAMPLNVNLGDSKQSFKNLIVSRDGDIFTKLGNITLLRYAGAVQSTFLNYFSTYTIDLAYSSAMLTHEVDTHEHPDAIDDLIMHYELSDLRYDLLTKILSCYHFIDFDHLRFDDFMEGVTIDDCLPVNCHLFDKYSSFQGLVLVVTFYLAVIGYVLFILQCIYQKATKVGSSGPAVAGPAVAGPAVAGAVGSEMNNVGAGPAVADDVGASGAGSDVDAGDIEMQARS